MGTFKMAGLQNASGEQGFALLDDGWYVVEVREAPTVKEKSSQKGDFYMLDFRYVVTEGDTQQDGKNPAGRMIFDSLFVPKKDHNSYDKTIELSLNRLMARCQVAGVEVSDKGEFDPEDFIDSTFQVYVKTEVREYEGEERHNNVVKQVKEL